MESVSERGRGARALGVLHQPRDREAKNDLIGLRLLAREVGHEVASWLARPLAPGVLTLADVGLALLDRRLRGGLGRAVTPEGLGGRGGLGDGGAGATGHRGPDLDVDSNGVSLAKPRHPSPQQGLLAT